MQCHLFLLLTQGPNAIECHVSVDINTKCPCIQPLTWAQERNVIECHLLTLYMHVYMMYIIMYA